MSLATRNCTLRIYPTIKQKAALESWLELHRLLYNNCLAERRDVYKAEGRSVGYNEQQNALPQLKKNRPEYIPLGSHALQETVRRVDLAFKAFFRRVKEGQGKVGYPRFKGYGRFDSFTYPCVSGWKLLSLADGKGRLKIGKLGHFKARGRCRVNLIALDRKAMPRCTIRRRNGKWYATIGYKVELSQLARPKAKAGSMAGLDAGLSKLGMLSDNAKVKRIRHMDRDADRIRQLQREVSRKKKGSANRRKAVSKLAAKHEKVQNRRKDYLHKQSAKLVSSYEFLAVEGLNVKSMMAKGGKRKRGLNRSMSDAALGMFLKLLASKAEEAGCEMVEVPPKDTTQACCNCGTIVPKSLYDRTHICSCGLIMDRDLNAAVNILLRGLTLAGREPSEVWRDIRPDHIRPAVLAKHETPSMRQHGGG